jgi:phosphopantothenoylcysteine decarboxylase/phosphopantothenate--cysteine ligase
MLRGKKILLGVSGSIAAYKSAFLIRELTRQGAEVKVVMTQAAKDFITPLTLATLSTQPVYCDFFDEGSGAWQSHVDLGLWADALVVAPASANTLAKFAHGLCDNLLTATYLSARCPVYVAPAMDLDMYRHAATQHNLEVLSRHNVHIIDPEHGPLASGLEGKGRMAEPVHIVEFLKKNFSIDLPLIGKKVLVTAGPTHEAIDPVRFIGNHSSGKMGFAIAEALAGHGAEVQLISGPTTLQTVHTNIHRTDVHSASEMYDACLQHFHDCEWIVFAAAVADYKPSTVSDKKLKKDHPQMSLPLEKTVDIAATLGRQRKSSQLIVGFALETDNEQENAEKKLHSKNFDMIVLNSLRDDGAGFGHDSNQIVIMEKNGEKTRYPLKSKKQVAVDIVDKMISRINA